nr:hypothetical protein [Tanacetum cinerariifolium]
MVTRSFSCPTGPVVSPLDPVSDVVAGTICFLISGRSRLKQCTNSTNFSGTKDAAGQEVEKDVSSLRYIALPNWVHDALLESSSSNAQDTCKTNVPESSRNPNPTASTTNLLADQMETLTVETLIPTVSSPIQTACFEDSPEPSTTTRIISKRVTSQDETPSLDIISTLANRFEDIFRVTTNTVDSDRVEADVSNMEITITANLSHPQNLTLLRNGNN